jgi:hypothetical protein
MIDDTAKQDSIDQPAKEEGVVTEKVSTSSDRSSVPVVDKRKLLRKIDLRLIPFFSLLYLLSFLDSQCSARSPYLVLILLLAAGSAIGNARVRNRWSIWILLFFSYLSSSMAWRMI